MKTLINAIIAKHQSNGIFPEPPAKAARIRAFEKRIGFLLPDDFREFYSLCNGFECNEDIFHMVSLESITGHPEQYGHHWFYFAQYMIYSDSWGLRLTDAGQYEIFNGHYPSEVLTRSLYEFLERFLTGNVFDPGGLYDWQKSLFNH